MLSGDSVGLRLLSNVVTETAAAKAGFSIGGWFKSLHFAVLTSTIVLVGGFAGALTLLFPPFLAWLGGLPNSPERHFYCNLPQNPQSSAWIMPSSYSTFGIWKNGGSQRGRDTMRLIHED
jgi:hypothetical protein